MKAIVRLAVLLAVGAAPVRGATDWKDVQDILGRKGEEDQGVLRVSFVRSDLKVMKNGVPVAADLVFDCWYGFWPMKDGTVMLMGDTCVRDDELMAVQGEMHRQGLDLTALHNHLTGESPKIMFLHLAGRGAAAELARKVKAVLARTATPTGREPEEPKAGKTDWSAITRILGEPAETKGDIIEYGFHRREQLMLRGEKLPSTDALETAPEVKFQMLKDGRAVTYGEMILITPEVAPVFHALVENGIEIGALHNHMTEEEPRLFFLHWWGVGKPEVLARGVKAALAPMNLMPEK
jgi:hypothetical protein